MTDSSPFQGTRRSFYVKTLLENCIFESSNFVHRPLFERTAMIAPLDYHYATKNFVSLVLNGESQSDKSGTTPLIKMKSQFQSHFKPDYFFTLIHPVEGSRITCVPELKTGFDLD